MRPPDSTTPGGPPTMNLLWSYVYARTLNLDTFLGGLPVPRLRFFADSGAHSARTLGLDISVDGYAAWVKRWSHWFTIYANLDVIWAPRATYDNQKRLEEVHGLHPMPVFHTGEPVSVLERYLNEGYTYIALGKLLGNSVNVLRPWLDQVFRMAEGIAVFHGFGMTVWPLLQRYRFYSVDSSTWGAGVRYGRVNLFHDGRWVECRLGSVDSARKHHHVLEAYGLPVAAVSRRHYDPERVAGACAVAFHRASQWLTARLGPVALPPGRGYPPRPAVAQPALVSAGAPGTAGPQIYLADAWHEAHRRHAAGLHIYLADASESWTGRAAKGIGAMT